MEWSNKYTHYNSTKGAPYRANVLLQVVDDVPNAIPPLAATRFEVDSRCMGNVLIRVDGGLGAVEDAVHVGILLHHLVEPLVVVGVLLVAHDRRQMQQGVVGVLASRDQHHTSPLALEVASIHAENLSHNNRRRADGRRAGGGQVMPVNTYLHRVSTQYLSLSTAPMQDVVCCGNYNYNEACGPFFHCFFNEKRSLFVSDCSQGGRVPCFNSSLCETENIHVCISHSTYTAQAPAHSGSVHAHILTKYSRAGIGGSHSE